VRIDEVCPVPVIEAGAFGNYLRRRRDMVMRNLPLSRAGGAAEGRFQVRIIADQMLRDFYQYLGSNGQKPTSHALHEFIFNSKDGPARLAELSKTFRFLK
jgi:hypothetical protein